MRSGNEKAPAEGDRGTHQNGQQVQGSTDRDTGLATEHPVTVKLDLQAHGELSQKAVSDLLHQPTTCTLPRTLTGKRNIGLVSDEEYNIIALERARERWRECNRRWKAAQRMNRPELFWVGDAA